MGRFSYGTSIDSLLIESSWSYERTSRRRSFQSYFVSRLLFGRNGNVNLDTKFLLTWHATGGVLFSVDGRVQIEILFLSIFRENGVGSMGFFFYMSEDGVPFLRRRGYREAPQCRRSYKVYGERIKIESHSLVRL